MKSSSIRELARHYATGELSLDEYRAQRRTLIDAVTSGRAQIEYRDGYSVRVWNQRFSWAFFVPVAAIILVLATSLLWRATLKPHTPHDHSISVSAAGAPLLPTGISLVHDFVKTNNWDDASLEQFMRGWRALQPAAQNAARQSYLYPRLISELREQITAQQAMAAMGADSDADSAHLAHLQKMAKLLRRKQKN